MNFADVVRVELTRIQASAPTAEERFVELLAPPPRRPATTVDSGRARLLVVEALERLEKVIGSHIEAPALLLSKWQDNDRVVRFVEALQTLLNESIGRNVTEEETERMIAIAIARRVGLLDSLPSSVKTLELDRLAGIAWEQTGGDAPGRWQSAAEYVLAIRAALRRGDHTEVTRIGQLFLQLSGKDAIRWLLNVEAAQSIGPGDDWRMSRETAHDLVQKRVQWFDWETNSVGGHSWATARRLAAMGLLEIDTDDDRERTRVTVLQTGFELLSDIAKNIETPMSIFAATLSQDLTSEATQRVGGAMAIAVKPGASEAPTRQARLVAHEIRNALVPVRIALDGLYRDVRLEPVEQVVERHKPILDEGVRRALRFIDDMLNIANLSSTPTERFNLEGVIKDALASFTGLASVTVAPSLPSLAGHRSQVVLALTNLVRNAQDSATKGRTSISVAAETDKEGRVVVIHVDDDGPGVPAEKREEIFVGGYTTTAGHAGMGLALVREVFEVEMGGKVTCEQSPMGGARFTVRLPVSSQEAK